MAGKAKGGENPCKLHEGVKYKLDERKEGQGGGPPRCKDCETWQRYILYVIPALIYIPWAINKLRCPPRCCPPPCCCPPPRRPCPAPRHHTCAPHDQARGKINPVPPPNPCPPPPKPKEKHPKDNRCPPEND